MARRIIGDARGRDLPQRLFRATAVRGDVARTVGGAYFDRAGPDPAFQMRPRCAATSRRMSFSRGSATTLAVV